jgi:hypothetical protein
MSIIATKMPVLQLVCLKITFGTKIAIIDSDA